VKVEHATKTKHLVPNFPVKFSKTPGEITSASPMLGQHTSEVLKNLLKMEDERIEELIKEGAIVQWKD